MRDRLLENVYAVHRETKAVLGVKDHVHVRISHTVFSCCCKCKKKSVSPRFSVYFWTSERVHRTNDCYKPGWVFIL